MLRRRDKWPLLLLALLIGCGTPPDDDDSADDDDVADDDDTTPPPNPLADVIGIFNLTNVVQAEGVSYVDFSGAFGTFVEQPDDVLSPAAYLGTFSYGASAPYWRVDLGAYPIPALGDWQVVDMVTWYPWVPFEETWWDGGGSIGAGNYLTGRLDLEDVTAYMVDDPVSPGAAGWTAGGTLPWTNEDGGLVVGWTADDGVRLPDAVDMIEPAAFDELDWPAAEDLPVRWTPGADGSFVTVGLINEADLVYIAHVPDDGEHVIPSSVLHDDFGPGPVELVVARNLQTPLDHPQGNILVRAREERRTTLDLLPDVALEPAHAEPGQAVDVTLSWFTADLSAGVDADFGEGITVTESTPDPEDLHRATLHLEVAEDALSGVRDVELSTPGGDTASLVAGFAVLDLLPSDSCTTADGMPALEEGVYASTTHGLTNDYGSGYGCLAWSLNGADAVYRVELDAGETLVATLGMADPADGALALLTDCTAVASAAACADSGLAGDDEVLVYTAPDAGTYYLVVDSWTSGSSGAFASAFELGVSIERDVIDPDWILTGASQAFVLFGEDPWDPAIGAADMSLGAGVGIDAVAAGSVPTELEFLATASAGAEAGARTITVENGAAGTVTFEDSLWVTGWPPYDSCAAAMAADSVAPGTATGFAIGTTGTIDEVSCMPYASLGPEVVLPIDLEAGQLLSAAVTLPDEDAQLYILSDCADPDACFDDAAVDSTLAGDEEAITAWEAPETGRYYVVVDVYSGVSDPQTPWRFDLTLE